MDLDRYRLPRTVEPSRYDLTIEPDDQSSTFTGGVDVAVTVNEPVTAIVLNAVELAIPGGSFTSVHGGRRIDGLDVTDPIDADGVPLRVVHVPGKAKLTRYALEAGAFSMRFFRDYYGIPYPAAKMDFIALPDFAQGAMENTGCITFRESLVLAD